MLANRDEYVLPALTASVDIAMAFEPFEGFLSSACSTFR